MVAADRILLAVFGCPAKDLAPRVIITPFLSLRSFKQYFQGEVRDFGQPRWFHGFTGQLAGRSVSVINCGLGAQRAADCVSFLSLAKVKRVLLAAAVGGLKPLKEGDLVLAGRGGQVPADKAWLKKARKLVPPTAAVFPLPSLALWANSARQRLWRDLARKRFTAIDLETAAVYAAARQKKISALAVHLVSDCPDRQPFWEPLSAEAADLVNRAKDQIPLTALAVLSQAG